MKKSVILVGLCLVLVVGCVPTSMYSPAVQPAFKSTPKVTILSSTSYRRATSGLWCDGEVRNDSSQLLTYMQASVTWYNDAGAILGTYTTYLEPTELGPGETATFKAYGDYVSGLTNYKVRILWDNRTIAETSGSVRQ